MAPGFARMPARARQVIGCGGKDISYRGPDVTPSITIIIDSVLHIARGHELILPHGPSPRARHGFRTHLAGIDDFKRLQQFTTKKRTTPTIIGERCQRGEDGEIARGASKVRFHTPEGHDDAWRHVVFRANL